MRFSHRTEWNTEESELSLAHRRRLASGLPVFDLTASNPTRCGFTYAPHLLDSLADPCSLRYDPDPKGSRTAREAVSAYYADHHVTLDPERLLLTTSTSEAYSFLFRLLCDPGSEILVPQPSYPLFDFLATLDDVRLRYAPFIYDQGWQIDPEALRRAITSSTRAIVLVHPNNPTGHFTKPWEAEELGAICRQHNLSLIVDEVFLDYALPEISAFAERLSEPTETPAPPETLPILETSESPASFARGLDGVSVFVVSGLSKVAALPQMKAAWIAVTGPAADGAMSRLEVIADTFLSMNAPIQHALPGWLKDRQSIGQQILNRVTGNLAELDDQLAQQLTCHGTLSRLKIEGGWYAILRIPALLPDEQTARNLLDKGVWVHPGSFFGMQQAGWLVVSLLGPVAEFKQGTERLVNYLNTNQCG